MGEKGEGVAKRRCVGIHTIVLTKGVYGCVLVCMIRVNVHFDAELIAALRRVSSETGVSVAELVRRAVNEYLDGTPAQKAAVEDRLVNELQEAAGRNKVKPLQKPVGKRMSNQPKPVYQCPSCRDSGMCGLSGGKPIYCRNCAKGRAMEVKDAKR
jgi:hypothetical protein